MKHSAFRTPQFALFFLLFIAGCAGSKTVSFMAYQPPDFDVSLVRTIAILDLEADDGEIGRTVESLLIENLMRHEYFTIVSSDQAAARLTGSERDSYIDTGRRLGVDAVLTGAAHGGVEDNYITQRNSKRVLTRYKTVTEYESRPVKETITVRVKEKGEWVTKTQKITVVKRVPVRRSVPVYDLVPYTEKYLRREGFVSVTLHLVDVATGNVIASRTASRRQTHRKLISSNEPPASRLPSDAGSVIGQLLAAVVESAIESSVTHRLNAVIPDRSEMIHALSAEVAHELADQISPRQISVVRRLKPDGEAKHGVKLARSGQWDQAGRAWQRAGDREPDNPAVWNNLGVYYERTGQYTEARAAYERAMALKPGERVYRQNMAGLASIVDAIQKQTAALGAKIEETSLGLLVSSVVEGTLAERLGLRKGDILERVNRKPVVSVDQLEEEITWTTKRGAALTVDLIRAGEQVALNLTLGTDKPRPVVAPARVATERAPVDYLPVADVDQVVRSNTRRPDALGVIFGIEDYRYAPSVPYARHDAMVVYQYFLQTLGLKPGNVYFRTDRDATQGEFRKVFDPDQGWLAKRIKPGQTEVFVYFTGHGAPDISTSDAYLIPADGDPNYPATSYRLQALYESLNTLSAGQVTVLIDACFSGRVGRGEQIQPLLAGARGIGVEARHTGLKPHVVAFTAAHGNQVSSSYPEQSHGLFTYFVLKGLKGHADRNSDSAVTIRELYAYVREHVMEQAGYLDREQTPELEGTDLDRVLVRY